MSVQVIVVDDEADIRDLVSDILKDEGFQVRAAANSTQLFELMDEKVPALIILDIWLQGSDLDGLGILEIVKKRYPLMPVLVISGHGTIETAVTAIKMGAYDYIEKPFSPNKLIIGTKRAYESSRLRRENIDLKSKVVDKTELIGESSVIAKLRLDIEKVAPTAGRIMLHGPIGSGKELVAKLIHRKSRKTNGVFVSLSPVCFSPERVSQELFGDYSGDKNSVFPSGKKRSSILEIANNGTLYIDEVTSLPLDAQTRLLKFLQDQILEKPDGETLKLDIRFITSTTKDLQEEIREGRFREDLYYRLNVVPIKVSGLAEKREDIPMLVEYFIKQLCRSSGLKERQFSEDSIAILQAYNWPGNIRQLRNVIEWCLIMNPMSVNGEVIRPEMLPNEIARHSVSQVGMGVDMMSISLKEAREAFEKQYLIAQMNRFNNNISKTSTFVGMERSALHRKLKGLKIHGCTKAAEDEMIDEQEEA